MVLQACLRLGYMGFAPVLHGWISTQGLAHFLRGQAYFNPCFVILEGRGSSCNTVLQQNWIEPNDLLAIHKKVSLDLSSRGNFLHHLLLNYILYIFLCLRGFKSKYIEREKTFPTLRIVIHLVTRKNKQFQLLATNYKHIYYIIRHICAIYIQFTFYIYDVKQLIVYMINLYIIFEFVSIIVFFYSFFKKGLYLACLKYFIHKR